MNNDIERQTAFLKRCYDISKANHNMPYGLLNTALYHELIDQSTKKEDFDKSTKNSFDRFFDNYNKKGNTQVINRTHFCHVLKNRSEVDIATAIKMYIPLDYDHVEKGF